MAGKAKAKGAYKKALRRSATYTTGDVSRACDVSPRTASKWIDSGELAGYRLPGCRDRRVPHDVLIRFMRDTGIPIPPALDGGLWPRVLWVGRPEDGLDDAFARHQLDAVPAPNLFVAGEASRSPGARFVAAVVWLGGTASPRSEALAAARSLQAGGTPVVAVAAEDDTEAEALRGEFAAVYQAPAVSLGELARACADMSRGLR